MLGGRLEIVGCLCKIQTVFISFTRMHIFGIRWLVLGRIVVVLIFGVWVVLPCSGRLIRNMKGFLSAGNWCHVWIESWASEARSEVLGRVRR